MSDFSVTFLGTGAALPDGERAQTGLLLDSPSPESNPILVDCGSGVLSNLARTNTGIEGFDGVLLTHLHLDHVADLLPLCKARWLAGAPSLDIAGPTGTEALLDGLFDVHAYLDGRIDVSVREIDADPFSIGGFAVRSFETRHSIECLAYRFEPRSPTDRGAPAFTFSADSEAVPDLCAFADGSTLAHDCSFPDSVDVSNHPTPAELGRALAGADGDPDRVYLTHLYPHTQGHHEAMLDSIADHYAGDVRFAHDGLTIEID